MKQATEGIRIIVFEWSVSPSMSHAFNQSVSESVSHVSNSHFITQLIETEQLNNHC